MCFEPGSGAPVARVARAIDNTLQFYGVKMGKNGKYGK